MNESPVANRETRIVHGVVMALLPSGLYQVEVEGAYRITVHTGGAPAPNFVRLVVGDRVMVELAARDRTRGRITKKL